MKKQFEKYKKIPVTVEAYQTDEELEIETLEGVVKADKNDWIIRGIQGELYPCKPDIFSATYQKANDSTNTLEDKYNKLLSLYMGLSYEYGKLEEENKQLLEDSNVLVNANFDYKKENEGLKQELQKIYDIATLTKAIQIIEDKYDDYLYDNDIDCIPCKRKAYIECLDLLNDLKDDLDE